MNFGQALEHIKSGGRAARAGWNGKGMWIVLLRPGHELPVAFLGYNADPCLAMRTAGGTVQPGWLASQADMLAEDWEVIGASTAATSAKKATIGDRVLYRCGGTDEAPILRPALVVRDWPGYDYVNLQVFIDGTNDDEHRGLKWSDGSPVFTPEERARGLAWRTSAFPGDGLGQWRLPS